MKIEKHFLNADFIAADDNYISDGNILIAKKYCNSSIINKLKTMNDIFEKCKNTVPFEKGEEFEVGVGTKC
ncbi:MAG: hypothetical protein II304_02605, partial [Bacteroidales bacterium]|nr:hypothetical protein [Bacteroidales bacterium]